MLDARLTLRVLDGMFSICRLDYAPGMEIPGWAQFGEFFSITRGHGELSIVCPQENLPEDLRAERGWKCLMLEGPLDFELTGIMAALTTPLAEAGVSIFAISTCNTDFIMVRDCDLERAVLALTRQGHLVNQ